MIGLNRVIKLIERGKYSNTSTSLGFFLMMTSFMNGNFIDYFALQDVFLSVYLHTLYICKVAKGLHRVTTLRPSNVNYTIKGLQQRSK